MKKVFLLILIFASLRGLTQPPTSWTKLYSRIMYVGVGADSNLFVPRYSTTPTVRNGHYGAGQLAVDTVGHKVWFYSGSTWREVAGASSYTFQRVFNTEVGGSQLTKSDTILLPYNKTIHIATRSIGTLEVADDSTTANGSVKIFTQPAASGFVGVQISSTYPGSRYGAVDFWHNGARKYSVGFDGNDGSIGHGYIDIQNTSMITFEDAGNARIQFQGSGASINTSGGTLTRLGIGSSHRTKFGGSGTGMVKFLDIYKTVFFADTVFSLDGTMKVSSSSADSVFVRDNTNFGQFKIRAQSDMPNIGNTDLTLSANRTLTLNSKTLSFKQSTNKFFFIDPTFRLIQFGDINGAGNTTYVEVDDLSQTFIIWSGITPLFTVDANNQSTTITNKAIFTGRLETSKGLNVSSANDLTLGSLGNIFHITGNTQINAIETADWRAGSEITLIFDSNPLVKNNTTGGGTTAPIKLAGGVDFSATSSDVLKLVFDGTSWYEVSRSVN